jgi:hypothetical protein
MLEVKVWNGKPVKEAGVYRDIPVDTYHSQDICIGPSVSSGNLRRVLECNGGSPAHMFAEWSGNKDYTETEDTAAYAFGRAAHHLLLGEPNFRKHYIVRHEKFDSWRSKESQDWRKQMEGYGLTALTPEEANSLIAMSQQIERAVLFPSDDPNQRVMVKEMLQGKIEHSFIWKDKLTGLWCKARPDAIPLDSGDFGDLKTTTSVQYIDLMRTIQSYAYHQQAAFIGEGFQQCVGEPMGSFTFVFVEKKPPHCVRPIIAKSVSIAHGAKQNRYALTLIARCLENGEWPGPGAYRSVEHIELSERYTKSSIDEMAAIDAMIEQRRKSATPGKMK